MMNNESVEDLIMVDDMDTDTLEEHSWVQWYQKSWLEIEEGVTGQLIHPVVSANKNLKGTANTSSFVPVRKGLIRFVYFLFDYSASMDQALDYKPNRCDFLLHQITEFLNRFFADNPLSYISLAALRDGKTHVITRMNGQKEFQQKQLRQFFMQGPSGACSLGSGIEWVLRSMVELPQYAARECIVVWGSLFSVEPRNRPIFPNIADRLRECPGLLIDVISMSPEVYAVKKLITDAGGRMVVVENAENFSDQLSLLVEPKLSHQSAKPVYVKMGFPTKKIDRTAKCVCHKELNGVYVCPQCGGFACELPTNCAVCKLTLVSKDMLTRVHRLLYEIPPYGSSLDQTSCFGCGEIGTLSCTACGNQFCSVCDEFVHEKLKHCPGCLTLIP